MSVNAAELVHWTGVLIWNSAQNWKLGMIHARWNGKDLHYDPYIDNSMLKSWRKLLKCYFQLMLDTIHAPTRMTWSTRDLFIIWIMWWNLVVCQLSMANLIPVLHLLASKWQWLAFSDEVLWADETSWCNGVSQCCPCKMVKLFCQRLKLIISFTSLWKHIRLWQAKF